MTLGKYKDNNSLINRLDARSKFIMLIVFTTSIFFINPSSSYFDYVRYGLYIFMTVFVVFLYILAKLKISLVFHSLKVIWFMILFLFIINIFFYKNGTLLFSFWIFDVYLEAILQTLKIAFRLFLLISFSTLFTATTKPLDITIALNSLFGFLKVFKVNVSILSMTISIALRFIPTILDETNKIMKAQASRGVDFINGKLKEKVVAITSLIVPLFISAILRSDELACSMEARNYNPLKERTCYRSLTWKLKDTVSLLISVIILAFVIFVSKYPEVFL